MRASTELIVLHTTEAPARSSINKVSERGECHFVVTEEGRVYAIVDRDREAFHAGRSMWRGREDCDKYSVGIECVGYHNKPMPSVQLAAIRELLVMLKSMYRVSDDRVVCHSHVAYGMPNRWQKRRHRGRKRCGMLFAMPSIRRALGLKARPAVDIDTRLGRLAIGDPYLQKVLYGSVDTMKGKSAAPPASSGGLWSGLSKWFRPAQPKASATTSPRKTAAKARPKPAGTHPSAARAPATEAQLRASGYRLLGTVSADRPAARIAGNRWRAADTFYTIRGKVIPGNRIDSAHIEKGTRVWRK